jgi:DNA-binding NarL/FixJ family response regulator
MTSDSQVVRVVIADDHAVVRAGLRAVIALHSNYVVVDEAQDAASLAQAVECLLPDLVVMDLAANGATALQVIRDIRAWYTDTRVLMLTENRSREHVVAALRAGVSGYVLKEASVLELLAALENVSNGQNYLSPEIAGFVIDACFRRDAGESSDAAPSKLSQRETQVLKLVARGRTSKEIAGHLYISPRTVEKHRARLMHKLQVSTVAALVSFAIGNGYMEDAAAAACGPAKVESGGAGIRWPAQPSATAAWRH